MSTDATPGGFVGDPAEAFTPPAVGGCCGGTVAAGTGTAGTGSAAGGCCGSAEATAAGECCTPAARTEAVDAGAGCCG
ncbi:MAG: hypothetical protein GEV28_04580 [Actinophytocola sp.]|uniref:hypothetical protein n=1 Tax=Actinophytocola sp. TaxID=1872138 RepID=UPI00132AACDD|nr:hypothetical protein [Actinophytocola sp.]MPZ79695.1 hypothetical protein [Actinophytocola sp.]